MVPELLVAALTVYLTLSLMYGRKIILWFLSAYPRLPYEWFLYIAWRISVYAGFVVLGMCLNKIIFGSY